MSMVALCNWVEGVVGSVAIDFCLIFPILRYHGLCPGEQSSHSSVRTFYRKVIISVFTVEEWQCFKSNRFLSLHGIIKGKRPGKLAFGLFMTSVNEKRVPV